MGATLVHSRNREGDNGSRSYQGRAFCIVLSEDPTYLVSPVDWLHIRGDRLPAWPDGVIAAALAEAVVAYRLVVAVNPALAVGRAGWAFSDPPGVLRGLTAASLAHSNSEARFSRRLLAFWLIPGLIAGIPGLPGSEPYRFWRHGYLHLCMVLVFW